MKRTSFLEIQMLFEETKLTHTSVAIVIKSRATYSTRRKVVRRKNDNSGTTAVTIIIVWFTVVWFTVVWIIIVWITTVTVIVIII